MDIEQLPTRSLKSADAEALNLEAMAPASVPDVATGPGIKLPRISAVLAWMRLLRIHHKVNRAASDHLRCKGLSVAQFEVLGRLMADEGIMQQELADALFVTKGNICQLLDRMEQSHLLVRRQMGRQKHVFLTERGRALFVQVLPDHDAMLAEQFSGLLPSEQVQLQRLLRKVDRAS